MTTIDQDQQIRNLAYYLWEKAGRPSGQEHDFWAQAAREVEGEEGKTNGAAVPENRFVAR